MTDGYDLHLLENPVDDGYLHGAFARALEAEKEHVMADLIAALERPAIFDGIFRAHATMPHIVLFPRVARLEDEFEDIALWVQRRCRRIAERIRETIQVARHGLPEHDCWDC